MTENYFFRTEDLCVGYNNIPLINNINIKIKKGEILTLIGPNGSGKSTILKSITKHLSTIKGIVYIDKNSLNNMTNKDLATKVAVVLTDKIRPEMMTCEDIVASGRYPYTNYFGKLTKQDDEIVCDSLKKVHALDLKDRDFLSISDGQRQRIMLARAICQEPEIIVLDEPTSYLDIKHKIDLLDILRNMSREKNITIIMSLHEIDLAPKISDKVACVKGDKISRFGTPKDIFKEEIINELYGLDNSSYNMLFGSVELPKITSDKNVFIVGGEGKGILYYRELQKKRISFNTGILYENDVDFQVAKSLAKKIYSSKAFEPVSKELINEAKQAVVKSTVLVDVGAHIGLYNQFNQELIEIAKQNRIPIFYDVEKVVEYLNEK
ncbi:ABC transporter ATP-binding protein [Sedimentibacter sp. zth1]|uniref:ABC transporter ATP-binding protein n=1 Tax=Sedimentibacter sp. zth1 TaxID=2816908 RepID=UPI001A937EF9|nr:ABC transporter ATP-binding protein [Sedimentibacter sp. zth1]QSX05348.1 ABC transporter ATP-binding protein [Sedimentibacter sp. zth1]